MHSHFRERWDSICLEIITYVKLRNIFIRNEVVGENENTCGNILLQEEATIGSVGLKAWEKKIKRVKHMKYIDWYADWSWNSRYKTVDNGDFKKDR